MAGEIQLAHDATAETLYAIVRNAVGDVWQTTSSTFVTYVTANIVNYDIALTEQGTASRHYVGDFPAVAAGVYNVTVYVRAGGSPAEGDAVAGAGTIEWDGTAVVANYPLNVLKSGTALERAVRCITMGTVGSASTTTSVVTSSLTPAAAVTDQFRGLVLAFDKDTTTANLRGQKTTISASTVGGVLTVTALTTAPVSGDTFVIE